MTISTVDAQAGSRQKQHDMSHVNDVVYIYTDGFIIIIIIILYNYNYTCYIPGLMI